MWDNQSFLFLTLNATVSTPVPVGGVKPWFHSEMDIKITEEERGFDTASRGINVLPMDCGRCKLFTCKCLAMSHLETTLFSLESLSRALAAGAPAG